MVFALLTSLASNVCCFLYPAYASYKALSIRPESSEVALQQVERWLMYWAVIGTWTAIEAVVGWSFKWLPFYNIFKTFVFVVLSLPQSGGSSYIYRAHLAPFFSEHEADIDAFLASLRSRAGTALAEGLGWAWEKIRTQFNIVLPQESQQRPAQGYGHEQFASGPALQPPTLHIPAGGAVQQLYGMLTRYAGQYGPLALTMVAAAASSANPRAAPIPYRAEQVPESISMPVPIPTPSPHITPSDPNLGSRTFQHASAATQSHGVSSARLGPQSRSVSTPSGMPTGRLSQHSSSESIHSHESGSGSGISGKRPGDMSYEQITRDEVRDVPATFSGLGNPNRPGIGEKRRSSSWFVLWGGATPPKDEKEKEKTE